MTVPSPSPDRVLPHAGWPDLHPTAQAAYNQILWENGLPRAEIAGKLGLSRTRLTAITRSLVEEGLIIEGRREQRTTTGRPAEMLHAVADRFHFLGVTVTGSRLVAAGVDLHNVVVWQRTTSLHTATVERVVQQVAAWLRQAEAGGLQIAAIAVSAPDPSPSDTGALDERALDQDALRQGLPAAVAREELAVPVYSETDIVALTAFEQWPQLAEGQDSMVLLALGEAIGVGVVTDRKVVLGAHHAAGRFGHISVGIEGLTCPLGHTDCLWSVCSTSAVLAAVPTAPTVTEVSRLAAEGDTAAQAALMRAARGAGHAAGIAVSLLDPDKVVFAGDVGAALRVHLNVVQDALTQITPVGPEVAIAATESVDWARATAAYAQYCTLSRRPGLSTKA